MLLEINRLLNRNKNISDIKRFNPQVLPPAGKNFYDLNDKSSFVTAQKYGSLSVLTPSNFSGSKNFNSQKINGTPSNKFQSLREKNHVKTGKRLFPQTYSNIYNNFSPSQFESPMKSYPKVNDMYIINSTSNLSKTYDHRNLGSDQYSKLLMKFIL